MPISLSEEEDLRLEAQLKSLNKPPTKTIYADWGGIYDCIEFHKQHAFNHPLIKRHTTPIRGESLHTILKKSLPSPINGCPKGTVPIRRTTKEDLIRANSFSPLASAARRRVQYRAGMSLVKGGQIFNGGGGLVSVWNPKVVEDQFSSAEISLKAGPDDQANEIKFGWMVNPQLYRDNLTHGFVYWTADGGQKTGCYNLLCHGYVQVDQRFTPDLPYQNISTVGGAIFAPTVEISLEPETGRWWLILEDEIKMGYWPSELFPLLKSGADSIYWGGHVKSGKDGNLPPMCSGQFPWTNSGTSGSFWELKYKDKDDQVLKPNELESTNDCKQLYATNYYADVNTILYGGTGGDASFC